MLQLSKSIEEAVANHCEAMGVQDHFKNWASSKSQTCLENCKTKIKKSYFLIVVLSVVTVQLSISQNHKGTTYFPIRMETSAPSRIDVNAGMENVKDITLQEISSDISYVKLEEHPGLRDILNVSTIDDNFLINTMDGVFLFDRDGKFVRQFIENQNDLTSVSFDAVNPAGKTEKVTTWMWSYYDGIVNTWYNLNKRQLSNIVNYYGNGAPRALLGFTVVNVDEISFNVVDREIHQTNSIYEKSVQLQSSVTFENAVGFGDGFVAAHYSTPAGREIITFSNEGDTLCRFPILSPMPHRNRGTGGIIPPSDIHYYYNDQYTFRYHFNDTVYSILSHNVIQPTYIIDLGERAFMPTDTLTEHSRILLNAMCEDDQYLYLLFNEGHDSMNNRDQKKVKFWWGLYHKDSRVLSVLPINGSTLRGRGITNDIDGGLPFWPQSVDNQGRKIDFCRGKLFKIRLTDEWFENSKASSPEKQEHLKQFVKTLSDDDNVVVIVK